VLTLALGIGANTAIFSVVDRLLARPLQVAAPHQLALLANARPNGNLDFDFNYPLFRDYQRDNPVFQALTATADEAVGLGTGGVTERQRALLVSGDYFSMLGVNAALGRTFAPNEGVEIGDAPVVVLSHGLWQRRFGADPQVIGRGVTINEKPFTVIGVAPREFTGTTRGQLPDLYVPITMYGQLTAERPGGEGPLNSRYFMWHQILGRLKDGVPHVQAQAAMQALARQIRAVTPANTATNLAVLPGAQGFTNELRDVRLPLNLLLATAGLVLLIACANLANLQLARASARTRDFAIRLALGARRGRLIRELLTESILLALLGGVLGVLVATWLVNVLDQFRPPNSSFELSTGLDARMLGFTLLISVLTGVLFGLAPSWRASRPQLVPELKGSGAAEERERRWSLRSALVVAQVALSLLVLVGGGLCIRSLQKLQQTDPGFEPSQVVLMSFNLQLNNYPVPRAQEFYERLLERVRTLPGTEAASLARGTPLDGNRMGMSISRIEGYEPKPGDRPWSDLNFVSTDYFRTFGVPLLAGRDFNATDMANGPKSIIVNEAFVQRYWPGEMAVGKRLFQSTGRDKPEEAWEVVGVVGSMASRGLRKAPRPMMFRPIAQAPGKSLTLAVRSGLEASSTIGMARDVVKSLDANIPMFRVQSMAQQKSGALALERMAATLLGGFGLLALLLAALGIYGVLAYSVSRRIREIGVRMALGAQISDVLALVLRQGLLLVGIGTMLGLASAIAATRLVTSFLHGINPLDPLTFAVVVCLLTLVAFVACWLPARRATKVDPMEALRGE
jgi:predicted permease